MLLFLRYKNIKLSFSKKNKRFEVRKNGRLSTDIYSFYLLVIVGLNSNRGVIGKSSNPLHSLHLFL